MRDVLIVQGTNWPQQCSPLSTVFDLIKQVDFESLKMTEGSRESPILVIDSNGGSQGASFCSLMSLWHQLEFEGCVDVFQLSRLYNYSRPGVWRSQVIVSSMSSDTNVLISSRRIISSYIVYLRPISQIMGPLSPVLWTLCNGEVVSN